MASSTKRIEESSVTALKAALLRSPILDPYISSNDKTPSWDGTVFVYRSESQTKANLLGRVPIQAKGTTCNIVSEKATFCCEVIDLQNYYRDGGCVFFLISVDLATSMSNIYYAALHVFDLKKILDSVGDQINKTIKLKRFPQSDTNEIGTIFISFIENARKQSSFVGKELPSLEQLQRKGVDVESVVFNTSGIGLNLNNIESFITTHSKKVLSEIKQTAKQVLDYAMQYDIVMRNVAYLSKVPKNAPEEHRDPLTDAQIQLVLNHWQGNRMGIPALIMLYCGLRKGEMIALQWSHVNLKDKTIFVEKSASSTKNQPKLKGPKTKAGLRIVPIPDFLADILRDCAKRKESMFVCPAAGGTMMTEQAWKNAWDSYMHHLNLCAGGRVGSRSRPKVVAMERFTAHQLRHTYATMLYNANVDVKSAQEYLGHSSIQTTLAVYTHLTPEKREASTKAFNDYLAQNNKKPNLSNG